MNEALLYKSDYEDIKMFLNRIVENIKIIEKLGYDTKDFYILYDMLRYEILSNKNINNMTDDLKESIIKNLYLFDGLISEVTKEIQKNNVLLNETNKKIDNYSKNVPKYEKKVIGKKELLSTSFTLFLTVFPLISASIAETINYKNHKYSPEVLRYAVDTNGHTYQNIRYDKNHLENARLIEYLETDKKGYRVRKTYELDSDQLFSGDELEKLDLSNKEAKEIEVIKAREYTNIPEGIYRDYTVEIKNDNINGITTDFNTKNFISDTVIITLSTLLLECIIIYMNLCDLLTIDYEIYGKIYHNIINFAQYKIILKKYLKELNKLENEKNKYEKQVNTLCSRIDKLILELTEKISNIEYLKQLNKIKKASNTDNKFKRIKNEEEIKKEQLISSINNMISSLVNKLSVLETIDVSECKELFHSIEINENILFEIDEDHFKINPMFIQLLKYFDLSLIDFSNVDIRYIDFRETNAVINIQKVFNKDISYAKFNDNNIRDFSNYENVNLTGTVLEEKESTMVNRDKAIFSNDTVLKR